MQRRAVVLMLPVLDHALQFRGVLPPGPRVGPIAAGHPLPSPEHGDSLTSQSGA